MSNTEPKQVAWDPQSGSATSPLLQLTLIRFREFLREPEAVFWTFIFPLLLASGLGLAFRSRPADVAKVGIRHSMSGFSICSWTASPDQPITATALPLVRSVE